MYRVGDMKHVKTNHFRSTTMHPLSTLFTSFTKCHKNIFPIYLVCSWCWRFGMLSRSIILVHNYRLSWCEHTTCCITCQSISLLSQEIWYTIKIYLSTFTSVDILCQCLIEQLAPSQNFYGNLKKAVIWKHHNMSYYLLSNKYLANISAAHGMGALVPCQNQSF